MTRNHLCPKTQSLFENRLESRELNKTLDDMSSVPTVFSLRLLGNQDQTILTLLHPTTNQCFTGHWWLSVGTLPPVHSVQSVCPGPSAPHIPRRSKETPFRQSLKTQTCRVDRVSSPEVCRRPRWADVRSLSHSGRTGPHRVPGAAAEVTAEVTEFRVWSCTACKDLSQWSRRTFLPELR